MPIFINETEIEDDAIFSEMQYHPADDMEQARDAAAQALVVRELLKQERSARIWTASAETSMPWMRR